MDIHLYWLESTERDLKINYCIFYNQVFACLLRLQAINKLWQIKLIGHLSLTNEKRLEHFRRNLRQFLGLNGVTLITVLLWVGVPPAELSVQSFRSQWSSGTLYRLCSIIKEGDLACQWAAALWWKKNKIHCWKVFRRECGTNQACRKLLYQGASFPSNTWK